MKYDTPVKALGMCLVESDRFSKRQGWGYVQVQGSTFPGREHWASIDLTNLEEYDKPLEVRDGTLRQFDPAAKVVWKGELGEWLDNMSELLHDHLYWSVFRHFTDEEPLMQDHLTREDIEPGEMPVRFNEDPAIVKALSRLWKWEGELSLMDLKEGMSDIRFCVKCESNQFHDSARVLALGPGGAQGVVVWVCEKHPVADGDLTYELTEKGIEVFY